MAAVVPDDLMLVREAARAAARAVAAVPLVPGAAGDALQKGEAGPVTVADLASQAAAIAVLRRRLGAGVAIVAEESADEIESHGGSALLERVAGVLAAAGMPVDASAVRALLSSGGHAGGRGRFWAIDPLDGTKGYLRGGQFAVAIALLDGGRPSVGALALPRLASAGTGSGAGVLLWAARGRGAFQEPLAGGAPSPVRAREWRPGDPVRLGGSVERAHSASDELESLVSRIGAVHAVRIDSQAKYALVARGDADAYVRRSPGADYREWIWDHAAGALVAEEAGCTVTDARGAPLDFGLGRRLEGSHGIVCAVPALHASVIPALCGHSA